MASSKRLKAGSVNLAATLIKWMIWGKRRLATQIRKQREGQYVLLNITLPNKATAELERNLRFLEPVMRHMLRVIE